VKLEGAQWTVLKGLIAFIVSYSIYLQLEAQQESLYRQEFLSFSFIYSHLWGFILCILLSLANWLIEAIKWRLLMGYVCPVSLWSAFRAVCTGISLGLFTPNRVGEYGGRVLFLPAGHRLQGVSYSLLGSLCQLIASLLLGILGFGGYIFYYSEWPLIAQGVFIVLSAAGWLILWMAYWNYERWIRRIGDISWIKKHLQAFFPTVSVSRKHRRILLFLSLVRHLIFSLEYVFILHIFGVNAGLGPVFILVLALFFAQTILPNWEVFGLALKSKLAIFFFGLLSHSHWAILFSAFLIWIFNLIAPAITGLIFLLQIKKINISPEND